MLVTEVLIQLPFNSNSNFVYMSTVAGGLNPLYDTATHQLRYRTILVPPRVTRTIQYLVQVDGGTFPPVLHYSTVSGTSEQTLINDVFNAGEVAIYPPYSVTKIAYKRINGTLTQISQATPGDTVIWMIMWQNDDRVNLTNATVRDPLLPTGFTFVGMDGLGPNPTVTNGGRTLSWPNVTIAADGGRFVARFTTVFQLDASIQVATSAACNDTYMEPNSSGFGYRMLNPTCITAVPRLEIKKSVSPGVVLPNQLATFTLKLRNRGTPINNVRVVDVMNNNLQFVSMETTAYSPTISGSTLTWNNLNAVGGSIDAPGEVVIKYVVRAPAFTGNYENTVSGLDLNAPAVSVLGDQIALRVVDQLISLQANGSPANVPPAAPVKHTLRINQVNNVQTNPLYITATLAFPGAPGHFTFVGDASQGVLVQPMVIANGTQVVWQNVPMGADGVLNMGLNLRAPDQFGTAAVRWEVSSPGSFGLSSASAQTDVQPQVTVELTVAPNSIPIGAAATYAITISSFAVLPIENIAITYTLPSGLTFEQIELTNSPGITVSTSPDMHTLIWRNITLSAVDSPQPKQYYVFFRARSAASMAPSCAYSTLLATSPTTIMPRVGDSTNIDSIARLCVTNGGPGPTIRSVYMPFIRR